MNDPRLGQCETTSDFEKVAASAPQASTGLPTQEEIDNGPHAGLGTIPSDYAPTGQQAELTDAQILALNAKERFFSNSPTKYPEAGHGTQYHAGAPGVVAFARAVIALTDQRTERPAPAGQAVGEALSMCLRLLENEKMQILLAGGCVSPLMARTMLAARAVLETSQAERPAGGK